MTNPRAPIRIIQMGGLAAFCRNPFLNTNQTVVSGPAIYPTSPAPCAKMTQHAEKTYSAMSSSEILGARSKTGGALSSCAWQRSQFRTSKGAQFRTSKEAQFRTSKGAQHGLIWKPAKGRISVICSMCHHRRRVSQSVSVEKTKTLWINAVYRAQRVYM